MTHHRVHAPLHTHVTEVLRRALQGGLLAPGTVLLEGPIAGALQCTRNPVRQALQQLLEEGLVQRFEGRGYLAGSANEAPLRLVLTPAMLGVQGAAAPLRFSSPTSSAPSMARQVRRPGFTAMTVSTIMCRRDTV